MAKKNFKAALAAAAAAWNKGKKESAQDIGGGTTLEAGQKYRCNFDRYQTMETGGGLKTVLEFKCNDGDQTGEKGVIWHDYSPDGIIWFQRTLRKMGIPVDDIGPEEIEDKLEESLGIEVRLTAKEKDGYVNCYVDKKLSDGDDTGAGGAADDDDDDDDDDEAPPAPKKPKKPAKPAPDDDDDDDDDEPAPAPVKKPKKPAPAPAADDDDDDEPAKPPKKPKAPPAAAPDDDDDDDEEDEESDLSIGDNVTLKQGKKTVSGTVRAINGETGNVKIKLEDGTVLKEIDPDLCTVVDDDDDDDDDDE